MKRNFLFIYLLFGLQLWFSCGGSIIKEGESGTTTGELESRIRDLGFKPFRVFYQKPYLGYIMDLRNKENPVRQVWNGKFDKSAVNQTIRVQYSRNQLGGLTANIPAIVKLKGKLKENQKVELLLLNLEKYNLVEPEMLNRYGRTTAYRQRPYIDSMLKAEKVIIRVLNKTGGAVDIKTIYGSSDYKYEKKYNGLIAAKKAFVGYTMRVPEAVDLPVARSGFTFSVLGWKKGISTDWKPLTRRSFLRSGDLYKLVLKADTNRPYYTYIFNIDSSGKIYSLFPRPGVKIPNPLPAYSEVNIPPNLDEGFILDKVTGRERIEIYVTEKRNKHLERLCRLLNKEKNYGKITYRKARRRLKRAISRFKRVRKNTLVKITGFTKNKGEKTYSVYNAHKILNVGRGRYYRFSFRHRR